MNYKNREYWLFAKIIPTNREYKFRGFGHALAVPGLFPKLFLFQ